MNAPVRFEVRVRGRLGLTLVALLGEVHARVAPRHTALTLRSTDVPDLCELLRLLQAAGAEIEEVIS